MHKLHFKIHATYICAHIGFKKYVVYILTFCLIAFAVELINIREQNTFKVIFFIYIILFIFRFSNAYLFLCFVLPCVPILSQYSHRCFHSGEKLNLSDSTIQCPFIIFNLFKLLYFPSYTNIIPSIICQLHSICQICLYRGQGYKQPYQW